MIKAAVVELHRRWCGEPVVHGCMCGGVCSSSPVN